jgi:two-component system cell cycle sensor histidine kinase/response regulator CckA
LSETNALELDYGALCDRINGVVLFLDNEFKIVSTNSAARRLIGEEQKLQGYPLIDLLPARDKARAMETFSRALAGESFSSILLSVKTSKGAERLISWQIESLPGDKAKLFCFGQDITETETLERNLMAANDKLASVLDNSTFAILTIDLDLAIDYVNRRGLEATEYTREEITGKPISEIFVGLNTGELGGFMATIYRGATYGPADVKLKTKGGTLIPYELTVDPILVQGTVVGAVITASDISQRKRAEERIRFQAAMLDQVESAVVAESLFGEVIYWNMAAEKLFGWKSSEVLGRNLIEILRPSPLGGMPIPSLETIKQMGTWNGDVDLERRDGTRFPARISMAEIIGREDKPMAVAMVVVDLTERLKLEEQLRSFNEQLTNLVDRRTRQLEISQEKLVKAERLAAIGELSAQVGHDLRNPLTSINTALYLLDKTLNGDSSEEARMAIRTMKKSVDHANRIIEELLEYSRAGISETKEEHLKMLIQSSIERLKIPQKIKIENQVPKDLLAYVDGSRMQRVFENLIKNSIDAMPKGGNIVIKGGAGESTVWLSFSDTGQGIRKKDLANLFKPLFTTKSQGMGLGLPICKRIVEAHGGSIYINSKFGKGTIVTIELPSAKSKKMKKELLDVGLGSQG